MSAAPHDLNVDFVASLPDEGPVVMVNLVRFREQALDGSGSGWDAYLRYSKGFSAELKKVGGYILWSGHVEGASLGDISERPWDFVVLVHYPSRADFLKTLTSPEYLAANVHREAALADHVILASKEAFSRFAPKQA